MCLDLITERHLKPVPEMIAYQIVEAGPKLGKSYRNYCMDNSGQTKRLGRRINATVISLYDYDYCNKYDSGFHCFVKLKDAINFMKLIKNDSHLSILTKVKAYEIHTKGKQWGVDCIVCKKIKPIEEIYVHKDVKKRRRKLGLPIINKS